MIVAPSPLAGAFVIDMTPVTDERGFFARSFCRSEFEAQGLVCPVEQCSVSYNIEKGTLRGMHFQAAPHDEEKLVRCTAGAVFDVILDLRSGSPSMHRWFAIELSAANRRALYIPKGFAHGFVTLIEATELLYMISVPYAPGAARGLRWNDPAFGIEWPFDPRIISARDAGYALLGQSTAGCDPADVR